MLKLAFVAKFVSSPVQMAIFPSSSILSSMPIKTTKFEKDES